MVISKDKIKEKTVNITPLFKKSGFRTEKIQIIETEGMYPYKEKVEDNWAYYTTVGCKHLKNTFDKEGKTIKDIGIVGICSGVEAIAILLIFKKDLQHLLVTDIDSEILKGTIFNLKNTLKKSQVKFIPLFGSFCEPIEKNGYLLDFVHANLPNLPSTGDEDLTKGAEKGTFLKSQLYEKYNPPKKFVKWGMGAQYAYLKSAKKVLKKGGSVITEFGGRVPLKLIEELFRICDLELQEVIVGFKEQTEALIDFIGYSRLEKEYNVTFEFYLYNESKKILEKNNISNPSTRISGEKIKKLLEPYKLSSQEALKSYKKGITIGHTVHLYRGIKTKAIS